MALGLVTWRLWFIGWLPQASERMQGEGGAARQGRITTRQLAAARGMALPVPLGRLRAQAALVQPARLVLGGAVESVSLDRSPAQTSPAETWQHEWWRHRAPTGPARFSPRGSFRMNFAKLLQFNPTRSQKTIGGPMGSGGARGPRQVQGSRREALRATNSRLAVLEGRFGSNKACGMTRSAAQDCLRHACRCPPARCPSFDPPAVYPRSISMPTSNQAFSPG